MNRSIWIGIGVLVGVLALALSRGGGRNGGDETRSGVLPGSAAAADWVAVLVDPADVVALPEQVARWSVVRDDAATWGALPRFPLFTSEAVMGHRPDLVLVSPWTDAAVVRRVREAGFRVLEVKEPSSWDDLLGAGRQVAEATGQLARFEAFAGGLEARRAALRDEAPTEPPRVLPYSNGGSGGFTMGTHTTVDLALELAGCVNVAAEMGIDGASALTDEQILGADFDWLLVSGDGGTSATAEILRSKDALANVPAVREGRILILDDALYSSGSYTILDAAERIGAGVR